MSAKWDWVRGAFCSVFNHSPRAWTFGGDLCTHLVITRLPFPAPTGSPVTEAASEYLNSQGEHPFTALSLEQASMRLSQSVGRLIRSETDSGEVTILDRRILDKSYGPRLLASLPRMKRVSAQAGSAA